MARSTATFVSIYENPDGEIRTKCIVDTDAGEVVEILDETSCVPENFAAPESVGATEEYVEFEDGKKCTAIPSETYNIALSEMSEDEVEAELDVHGNGVVVYDA